MFQLSIQF